MKVQNSYQQLDYQHRRALPMTWSRALFEQVARLLRQRWSLQQIAAQLSRLHLERVASRAS